MAAIRTERLVLRPIGRRDQRQWDRVRKENLDWLVHWEATVPVTSDVPKAALSFKKMIRIQKIEAKEGKTFSFGIFIGTELIGQITLGGIIYGALRAGHIGYWIAQKYANRGMVTEAVIGIRDFGFKELELHRLEINVRPENAASIRVAQKAGFTLEGERKNYLHINGAWRNHLCFVAENPAIR